MKAANAAFRQRPGDFLSNFRAAGTWNFDLR
jgi:hypothetical protein